MNNEKMDIIGSDDVRKVIDSFLQDRFEMPEDYIPGGEDEYFFGLQGLLTPRDLTYLAYMLEQRYNIHFSMEEYDDPRFYCLSGLSEIISNMLNVHNNLGGR